jgi:hypothetical protein
MKRHVTAVLLATVAVALLAFGASAYALEKYLDDPVGVNDFHSVYPTAIGKRIDSCLLCHVTASGGSRNPYGVAFAAAGRSFTAIAAVDSDGDTYSNNVEILAFFYPGNPADHPSPPADTTAPVVTSFDVPATSSSLTVPINGITATDAVGVTGYLVNESATKPGAGDAGWTAAVPTSFTATTEGTHTLYAYAKDAANNVSDGLPATVTITTATVPPPTDTTPPTAGEPIFSDDFADAGAKGDPNWERVRGRFLGQRGALVSQGRKNSLAVVRNETNLDPFLGGRIEVDLQAINPSKGTEAGIVFDYQDKEHYRYVLLNSRRGTIAVGEVNEVDGDDDGDMHGHGGMEQLTRKVKLGPKPRKWHHLTVDVDSATGAVTVYLDGGVQPAATMTFASVGQGRVGLFVNNNARKVAFDNFKVWEMSAQP